MILTWTRENRERGGRGLVAAARRCGEAGASFLHCLHTTHPPPPPGPPPRAQRENNLLPGTREGGAVRGLALGQEGGGVVRGLALGQEGRGGVVRDLELLATGFWRTLPYRALQGLIRPLGTL